MDSNETVNWLLEGDPSVRYQVFRDLLSKSDEEIEKAQLAIATSGWGRKLLNLQDEKGLWGGGLYSPKWTSTHYTLLTLKLLGLHPDNGQGKKAAQLLLDRGYYRDGGINFFVSIMPVLVKYGITFAL